MSMPLLRLYPPRFRREFGAEIAEFYYESTREASRKERFREAYDIAAHALRMRLGLGSAQRGGRAFAAAAPFALAATASFAGFNLLSLVADWRLSGNPDFLVPLSYATGVCHLVALLGAVLALGGRFAGARWAAAGVLGYGLTLVLPSLPQVVEDPGPHLGFLLPQLLVASMPLACPPDLRPVARVRSGTGEVALLLWAPLLMVLLALVDVTGMGLIGYWRYGMPVLAALVLAGRPALRGIRTAGQFVLAVLPFVVTGYFASVVDQDEVLPVLALVGAGAVVLALWRGRGADAGTGDGTDGDRAASA
ncbi:hypothetical protein [Streptomyces sp. NPDC097619]|uniref:hypothetical protein n=1 Tax=Streptomyces sp. NPDC097619 TaxID=3157228 RepID=UPI00331F0F16